MAPARIPRKPRPTRRPPPKPKPSRLGRARDAFDGWRSIHGIPVLALIVFTLVFYGRLRRQLGTGTWPNDLQDGAMTTWNLWHFPERLFHFQNPFETPMIYFPEGAPLGFHTYAPVLGILSLPLVAVFGMTTTYTLITLLGPVLSAMGAYLFAHDRLKDRWAALFAGAAYAMLPDRVLRMAGHMNLNHTELLPFTLLILFRFVDDPSNRNGTWLGVLMALSLWLESIFTAFLAIGILVVLAVQGRRTFTKTRLRAWGRATSVGLLLASPVLIAMTVQVARGELDPIHGWGASDVTSADALSYLVPSDFHPFWKDTPLARVYAHATSGERFTFVGWTVLALAGLAAWTWRDPHKRTVLWLTGVFAVLSLGPFLHVNGWQGDFFTYHGTRFSIPLPYFLLHFTPILNGLRIPARFSFMTALALALLAAAGLRWLNARYATQRRPWVKPVFTALAIGILAFECLPGTVPGLSSSAIPAPYDAIRDDPGVGAVLELPLQWRDGLGKVGDHPRDDTVFMYYAIHHGKPISGGMVARYPDNREARLVAIPVYRDVLALQDGQAVENATFTVDDLRTLGIAYVAAHRDRPVPNAFAYMQHLGMPVLADDGTMIVWRVPP